MERLYIELEDVIKDNIQKGNEQLLTMEQFSNFLNQNVRLKDEIKELEQEKMKLDEKYSQVLKENVLLRKKDEEYDKQRVEDILKSYDKEKNKTGKDEAIKKINEYQNKQNKLNKEYDDIKEKIENLILNLRGLNIESNNFNQHLNNIKNELLTSELDIYSTRIRNKSISFRKMKMKKISNNDNNNIIRMQMNAFYNKKIKKNKK